MSDNELSNAIKAFTKFLEPDLVKKLFSTRKGKKPKISTIDDILKLPVSSFNFLDDKEAKILEDVLDIFDIGEVSKLKRDDPFAGLINLETTEDPIKATEMREKLKKQIEVLKKKFPNLESHLKKAITISAIIKSAENDQIKKDKASQKVIVVGLDNAGKTAILSKFGGGLKINDLAHLKPTKGIERHVIEKSHLDLFIWDFGGQDQYREKYLNLPEKYFLQTDLLIYVIDVQDPDRFDESFDYFNQILDILKLLEENPYMLVFLHKVDPDLEKNTDIKLNIEYLTQKMENILAEREIVLEYEMYTTSIYTLISNEPKFSKYIKDVMKVDYSINDPTVKKIEGLGRILEETMNAVIRLSESISLQINELDNRVKAIEAGAYQMAQSGTPIEISTPKENPINTNPANARTNVMDELKDLFAKKKNLKL